MVLLLRRAFFYIRPGLFAPALDCFSILFPSQTFGLLAAPIHRLQDLPNVAWVVGYLEVFFDYLGDPLQCPELIRVPMRLRALKE